MAKSTFRRFLLVATLVAAAGCGAAIAAEVSAPPPYPGAGEGPVRFVPLGLGKSLVVDLPRDAKDVLVANPAVANAVVRSARRAYIIGVAVGQTNVFFFDAEGRQIAGYDIAVTRDLNGIRAAIRQAIPHADIRVEGIGADGVVLTGTAASPAEAQQAFDIATRLLSVTSNSAASEGSKIVNAITVRGRDQVMLKVTVAEVQRDVIKQLGVNVSGSFGTGANVVSFNSDNPFPVVGKPISNSSVSDVWTRGSNSVRATLLAMERAGVIRTLAEPNLTAVSGESASFLVGGEFPVPGGYTCDTTTSPPTCQIQIQFKKFGVGLTFTPVVLSEGRISLKVMTEVSELSSENSITLQPSGQTQPISIPSIRVRRADTTVEIPSGGALAMAGMIQEQTKQQISGLPGLMQLPILGTLFRSRDYQTHQTELMVLVTPYAVRAVAPKDLSRPDDGFADSSDPAAMFLGRLNRLYGVAGHQPPASYHGRPGFILD
jgi:pilus assembly protein CpaC